MVGWLYLILGIPLLPAAAALKRRLERRKHDNRRPT
jgi:hypothetical protein